MSRKRPGRGVDKSGRSKGGDRHVRLHRWLLRSPAWQHLLLGARCLLVELYDLYDGKNNGELFLSTRDAASRLRVGKNTATALFSDLMAKGFTRPRQRGSFNLKVRHATSWVLTEFEFPAGVLATKDFMRWRCSESSCPICQAAPEIQNTVPPRGTDVPRQRDRGARIAVENGGHGPSHGDREAPKPLSPVPPTGTQVSYQAGGVQADQRKDDPTTTALRLMRGMVTDPGKLLCESALPEETKLGLVMTIMRTSPGACTREKFRNAFRREAKRLEREIVRSA